MPTLDLTACVGLLLIGFFALLVIVLVLMRDRAHEPWHAVTRWVWCPPNERWASVEFMERVQTGLAIRRIRHCPLRHAGERCGEGCAFDPAGTLRFEPERRADRRA